MGNCIWIKISVQRAVLFSFFFFLLKWMIIYALLIHLIYILWSPSLNFWSCGGAELLWYFKSACGLHTFGFNNYWGSCKCWWCGPESQRDPLWSLNTVNAASEISTHFPPAFSSQTPITEHNGSCWTVCVHMVEWLYLYVHRFKH